MGDLVQEKLREILVDHGRRVMDDPTRLEALLRDHCGGHRREISALLAALKEGVPCGLESFAVNLPREAVLASLTHRLQENQGLAEDAARWAVETWAVGLGLVNEVGASPKQSPKQVNYSDETRSRERMERPIGLEAATNAAALEEANKRIQELTTDKAQAAAVHRIPLMIRQPVRVGRSIGIAVAIFVGSMLPMYAWSKELVGEWAVGVFSILNFFVLLPYVLLRVQAWRVQQRLTRGAAFIEQERWADAISEYRVVVRLNQRGLAAAEAHYNLGAMLEKGGDRQGAMEHYVIAHKLAPNDSDCHTAHERLLRQLEKSSGL